MKRKKKPMTRSEVMSRVKNKDTSIEVILRKELWKRGHRYRKNYKKLIGKPDIVFIRARVAIFCDSEFWHGKQLSEGKIPKTNTEFWVNKINSNIERDKRVDEELSRQGWTVLRFWGEDIKKNTLQCIEKIESYL